jgi:hypothetical protein
MKKLLTLLLCALTFAISAQNNTGVLVMQTNAQLPVTASVDVPVQVKSTTDANTAKPSPTCDVYSGRSFYRTCGHFDYCDRWTGDQFKKLKGISILFSCPDGIYCPGFLLDRE